MNTAKVYFAIKKKNTAPSFFYLKMMCYFVLFYHNKSQKHTLKFEAAKWHNMKTLNVFLFFFMLPFSV